MKIKPTSLKTIIFVLVACFSFNIWAVQHKIYEESTQYTVTRVYKVRPDGKPGREILLKYNGKENISKAKIELITASGIETQPLKTSRNDSISILLPPEVGVNSNDTITVNLLIGRHQLSKIVPVFALRHWTVYIYPHSHVDIGYTNTQKNVEFIHKRNLEVGMELAEKTKNYPKDARYVWNSEVGWPVERYLKTEPEDKRNKLIAAIKNGYISTDAGYVNTNTSSACDEELFKLFSFSKELEKLTGKPMKTMVQTDVPGVSWGVVPVASQLGISYCLALYNGDGRTGHAPELDFHPFWWKGADGKSKVLFLQPGSYNPGEAAKGKFYWPSMAGQTDTTKLLRVVKTAHPREHFIDAYLAAKLPLLEKSKDYPYDLFAMSWAMADNTPIDADLPDAVKSWNEEFAYPHLVICTATQMMQAFDTKYGAQIPVLSGDYTEYWTDGLGSAARETGVQREVKERLLQTETLWSMLHPYTPTPKSDFDEAWRNVIMGTEHTWAYMDPAAPLSDEILKVKFNYFHEADIRTKHLLAETLDSINTSSTTIAVFNTHSWSYGGLVKLSEAESKNSRSVYDENGKEVLSQRLSTGELAFLAQDVPAFGAKKYRLSTKKSGFPFSSFVQNNTTLDNKIVKLKIDPLSGDVSSLQYEGKEFVDQKAMSAINSYRYLHGDDSPGKATKPYQVHIKVKENGPLISSLIIQSDAEGCNSLSREVSLIAGDARVEFCNIVDKQAITAKEGIHFGFAFNVSNPSTKVDVPWGVMQVEKDQLAAGNRNWIAMQRWLDVSNEDHGVTWCSLNACTFESGDLTANILGMATHSTQWINKLAPSSTIYSWALNNHWFTNFPLSQQGIIKFQYRLLPHNNKFDAATSNRFGLEQIQPLIVTPVKPDFKYDANLSITSDPSIVSSLVKTINGGHSTLIRLRSVSTTDQSVKLNWKTRTPKSIHLCDYYQDAGTQLISNGQVTVPAMGFVTLRADW